VLRDVTKTLVRKKGASGLVRCAAPAVLCAAFFFSLLPSAASAPSAGDAVPPRDGASSSKPPAHDPAGGKMEAAVLYRPVLKKTSDLGPGTRNIRVLVHYGRTEFFVANGRPFGFECEAFTEYEKFLNKSVRKKKLKIGITFIPVRFEELIPFLLEGKGDIAAGFITATAERRRKAAFTNPYIDNVSEVLVAHAGVEAPKSLNELSGRKVHVLRGSSFAQHLRELNGRLKAEGHKPVEVVEMPASANADDILEMVNAGILEFTFVDDFIARLWEQILPQIKVVKGVKLNEGGSIAWAVRPDNPELLNSLNAFIDYAAKNLRRRTAEVMRRYFKDTKFIENPLANELSGRVRQLSPMFKEAGERKKLDWLMMMAQGYQESQLDQRLRSRKGAIGIMQLLPATGRSMGYRDITKARSNIAAGVAYLDWIRSNYFNADDIPQDARVDFSLAAYNAGPMRIEAMRREARRRGLNPNLWFDHVERVCLDKIGEETVRYVANVNRYYIAYRMSHEIDKDRNLIGPPAAATPAAQPASAR
jgi:membrane-bound lytic murein transglycosylase MltF